MDILISGSIAYDRIMDFPGKFSDHILSHKLHILNVSFMVNDLKENFGGTAGNIAYTLSLLGENPTIIATAGRDFGSYKAWMKKHNINTNNIKIIEEVLTAGAYITTDQLDNQITTFNPGAMNYSADFDFTSIQPNSTIALIGPGNLNDMHKFAKIYKEKGIDYIFDPGQSLPAWNKNKLLEAVEGAKIFISNDYELQLTMEKTSMSLEDIIKATKIVITTKGEYGSIVQFMDNFKLKSVNIPVVKAYDVKDPTGAGDAYRGGLIKGLLLSDDICYAAKIGSTSSAYAVEEYGTQTFSYSIDLFNKRFCDNFGQKAF